MKVMVAIDLCVMVRIVKWCSPKSLINVRFLIA